MNGPRLPREAAPSAPAPPAPGAELVAAGAVRDALRAAGAPGRSWWVPTPADLVFLSIALLLPLLAAEALLSTDGDVARHIRLGEWMLDARAVIDRDLFSFTREEEPFLAFEWLSEVLYAAAYRVGGLPGVALLASAVIGAAYALVYRFLRAHAVDPLLALAATLLGALAGMLHWLARPHLFSLLGTVLLLGLLERPGRSRLLLVAPLFAAWANLHGGFLYGLILIAAYVAGDAAELLLNREDIVWRRRLGYHAAALAIAALAAVANPAGPALLTHVASFFGVDVILDATVEFRSPDFHRPYTRPLLAALLLVIAALAHRRSRPPLPWLLLVLLNTAFALFSARNAALFGVAAVPVAALALNADWQRSGRLLRVRGALGYGEAAGRAGVWSGIGLVLLVVLALRGGEVAGKPLLPAAFDPVRFPVAAVEQARAAGLDGRIFNEFGWGGYMVFAWPEQRVFIDGVTDHYGPELVTDYLRVAELNPGWREVLERWRIDHVLVPPASRLAAQLAREPGWRIWYCDAVAVLLTRRPGSMPGGAPSCPVRALPPG